MENLMAQKLLNDGNGRFWELARQRMIPSRWCKRILAQKLTRILQHQP
jgi:hypothetical protein